MRDAATDPLSPQALAYGRSFAPFDWYWIAEDGRVFASARETVVTASDPGYLAWTAGGPATPWPRDAAGLQTDAALQAALDPYGLFATLQAYAAARRYAVETGGIVLNGVQIRTDRESQGLISGAYLRALADPATVVSFKAANGFVSLSGDEVKALALAVGAHVQACFAAEDAIDQALAASPPTITTRAEIDARFAALGASS